ncbi:hypothetical protein [Pseudosulfitobacter pseudonitzschiae]|uniref:hypothetical protein n=1 Tax=Pseudosulfitobacter pseudonitzschiae TaxID=1402135 RepID=UPI003B80CDEA
MSGKLIFAGSKEAVDRIGQESNAFRAHGASDLPGMLDILGKGGLAVANMLTVSAGYRIPEGCEIDFDESCPSHGAERLQAEGRKLRLFPHQEEMMAALSDRMAENTSNDYVQSIGRTLRPGHPAGIEMLIPGSQRVDEMIMKRIKVKSPFQGEKEVESEVSPEIDR